MAERAPGQSILLDTTRGNPIKNRQDHAISEMFLNSVPWLRASVRPPSRLRTDPNPRYNCHGLTFAARRTCILDDSEVGRILREDDYELVGREGVLPGDIAVYYADNGSSIDHSGIVVSAPEGPGGVPMICSKWAWFGEVVHRATDVRDAAIADIRYYRVRGTHGAAPQP